MVNKEIPQPKGLSIGSSAPCFEIIDIDNNHLNLIELLKAWNGVLIDFFIGSW